jgi:uncharacterized membrane protein
MKESILAYTLLFISLTSCKKEDAAPLDIKYFATVKKIISTNCLQCHNSTDPFNSWSGRPVKLDSDDDITTQYINIKASVADPISFSNKRMPLGSELAKSDIDIIVKWYDKGGKSTD